MILVEEEYRTRPEGPEGNEGHVDVNYDRGKEAFYRAFRAFIPFSSGYRRIFYNRTAEGT